MELLHYINTRLNELKTSLIVLEANNRDMLNSQLETVKARIQELEEIQDRLTK